MNIGVDIRPLMTPKKTGIGQYTQELLDAIFKADSQNHYWLFYNSQKPVKQNFPNWQGNNIHLVEYHWTNKIFNLAVALKIIKLDKLIQQPLDYWYSPNLNFTHLSANLPHILTIHDLSFEFFPEFFTFKQRGWHKIIQPKKQCEKAYKIITPSENTKRDLIQTYKIPTEKIQVIYPGLPESFHITDEQLLQQKINIQTKYSLPENYILYFGAIEPRKNIIMAVKAFEKCAKQIGKNYHLILAGASGWKNNALYRYVVNSPLRDKIKFLGYISKEDKPALYGLSKLFVFPSFYEGFGFPPLEAMAMGIPTIVSARSSLFEIGENNVMYINPNHTEDLSASIIQLLNNEKLYNFFSTSAKNQVKKYRSKQAAEEMIKIFNLSP